MNSFPKYIILFIILCSLSSFAQKYTISGYIKDNSSNEDLIGANVVIKELNVGTVSNKYGFFSITVPKGKYTVEISFISFKTVIKTVDLNKSIKLTIDLETNSYMTDEVLVTGERTDENIKSKEMSVIKMPVDRIKELPVLFGEVDILKTIQLLPGVQSGGEGSSGFYVRGGGPDQNLILLDDAVVYNASHLMGFMSVFNADAVNDID